MFARQEHLASARQPAAIFRWARAASTGFLGSGANPIWPTLSLSTYNGYIRNGTTGAKPLNLPLVGMGAQNTALVTRPAQNSNEDTTNPQVFGERYYSQVSLRILLSDTAADIMNLPGVTATAPISLEGNWNGGGIPAG